jgi:hypothetical protein
VTTKLEQRLRIFNGSADNVVEVDWSKFEFKDAAVEQGDVPTARRFGLVPPA